mgnify:CR=1 FL=1
MPKYTYNTPEKDLYFKKLIEANRSRPTKSGLYMVPKLTPEQEENKRQLDAIICVKRENNSIPTVLVGKIRQRFEGIFLTVGDIGYQEYQKIAMQDINEYTENFQGIDDLTMLSKFEKIESDITSINKFFELTEQQQERFPRENTILEKELIWLKLKLAKMKLQIHIRTIIKNTRERFKGILLKIGDVGHQEHAEIEIQKKNEFHNNFERLASSKMLSRCKEMRRDIHLIREFIKYTENIIYPREHIILEKELPWLIEQVNKMQVELSNRANETSVIY